MVTETLSTARAETRSRILAAASELFGSFSYEAVTMRQVASRAECSHTVIYQYFADKDALLSALALPVLAEFDCDLDAMIPAGPLGVEVMTAVTRRLLATVFQNRRLARIWLVTAGHRIDMPLPAGELPALRQKIIDRLGDALGRLSGEPSRALELARIFVYLIVGIAATYEWSPEPSEELVARLGPTFDNAVRRLVAGELAKEAP